jgi:hypothetical protein
MINVFIVPPTHVHFAKSAVGFIHTMFRIIAGITEVRIQVEIFRINNFVGISATNREGIAHNGPLGFSKQTEHFAHIM